MIQKVVEHLERTKERLSHYNDIKYFFSVHNIKSNDSHVMSNLSNQEIVELILTLEKELEKRK